MKSRRVRPAARDQDPSGFSPVLQSLCDSTMALSAALVDSEGETVDYASQLDPFETRVAAAEWGLIVRTLSGNRLLCNDDASELHFRGTRRSFTVIRLSQGYSLVVETPALSMFLSKRAVIQAVHDVSIEAGLKIPQSWVALRECWVRVIVKCDGQRRRPIAILRSGAWLGVHVLGKIAREQLGRSESGFRVRSDDGAELTLVREPLSRWYVETSPDEASAVASPTRASAKG